MSLRKASAALGLAVMAAALVIVAGCTGPADQRASEEEQLRIVDDIGVRRAKFQQQDLSAEISHLPASEQQVLGHLVTAARAIDEIFKLQAWTGNPELAERVAALQGPDAEAARDYYRIMYGPWDRLLGHEPFLGDSPHPEGAGYYPEDMSEEEFSTWLEAHPEDREAFTSLFTVIRRDGDRLVAIPYFEAYSEQLSVAADELRAAAAITENDSLRRFLELRAEAFFSNDYYESDIAWMDLDSPIEVVIGPYETYEDGLFGYKAAFECFLCVAQPEASKRLAAYKHELPFLEQSLPIADEHKNLERGAESPIRVVDELFTAGDTRAGVQTLAFNLPNDERVREAKGSKKVMLQNIMNAKYEAVLTPIAARVLAEGDAARIDPDAYFHFILFHELAHGLGPGRIVVDGRDTEVRLELKEFYSAIEEAKADVLSVFSLKLLADKGVVPAEVLEPLPWTYTAGLFRSARFGVTEAHGLGVVLQANYLLEQGAIVVSDGRFSPVPERFYPAFEELAGRLLMLQALGSYEDTAALLEQYGTPPPDMKALLGSLDDIPVDIDPVYHVDGLG